MEINSLQEALAEKPWLTCDAQIKHLKSKGVSFNRTTEKDALEYLCSNNNYFRLRSYRSGFQKKESGPDAGKYINLDFAMLQDLATIDYEFRQQLLPMTIDVEHYSKVELLRLAESAGEDGYSLVAGFIDESGVDSQGDSFVLKEIDRGLKGPYTKGLIESYGHRYYPLWAFVELIPFGTFNRLWMFASKRIENIKPSRFYELQSVKGLRNACAHNNCVINDMSAHKHCNHKVSNQVKSELGQIGVGKRMLASKMQNERLQQVASTFYLHQLLASDQVKSYRAGELKRFKQRMFRNKDYYGTNVQIASGFQFIGKLIDGWY